jgi:DNA-binding response OmpR family regulator
VTGLSEREAAVLAVLEAAGGRVVSRVELARAAGLEGLSPRRVDGVLVRLRRALPPGALVTVRARGWALVLSPGPHRVGTLRKRAGHPGGTPAAYGP